MRRLVRPGRGAVIFFAFLFCWTTTALIVSAESSNDEKPRKKTHAKATPSPTPAKAKKKTSAVAEKKPKSKKTNVGTAKKSKTAPKTSASKKRKPKAEAEETPVPKKTPAPEKTPASVKREAAAPKPSPLSSATIPRAVAIPAPPAVANVPADITIQKSGVEEEQGYEPPPPPPPPRGFWSRLFGSREAEPSSSRYLSRSVIESIRNAPVLRGRWKFIVVHNSGTRQGNARAFDYYHRRVRRMTNGLAYHFVIGNGTSSGNGQIEIGDRWRRQINGGHVHSDYLNNIALGICLVGDFNRDQPTRAQLDSCEELIRYLRVRCGKADGRNLVVRPHREVNPPQWATDCPGDAFPYQWFGKFRN